MAALVANQVQYTVTVVATVESRDPHEARRQILYACDEVRLHIWFVTVALERGKETYDSLYL